MRIRWRQETADPPFGPTRRYMTSYFGTIGPRSSLSEMVRHIVDTRADELIVLDEFDRPADIVSAADILIAVVDRMRERAKTRKERITARKPK